MHPHEQHGSDSVVSMQLLSSAIGGIATANETKAPRAIPEPFLIF